SGGAGDSNVLRHLSRPLSRSRALTGDLDPGRSDGSGHAGRGIRARHDSDSQCLTDFVRPQKRNVSVAPTSRGRETVAKSMPHRPWKKPELRMYSLVRFVPKTASSQSPLGGV